MKAWNKKEHYSYVKNNHGSIKKITHIFFFYLSGLQDQLPDPEEQFGTFSLQKNFIIEPWRGYLV